MIITSKLQDNISNYRIKNFSVGGIQSFLRLEEMLSKSNDIKVVVAIYVSFSKKYLNFG